MEKSRKARISFSRCRSLSACSGVEPKGVSCGDEARKGR